METTQTQAAIDEREEDLAFSQGFGETTTEAQDPAAVPAQAATTAEPEANAAANAEPEADAPAVDPFQGLPQEVRELLGRIPMMETQLREAQSLAGRVPQLQSQLAKLTAAPAPAAKFEKVEALRGDFPEVAEALDQLAAHNAANRAEEQPEQPASDPQMEALDGVRPTWATEIMSSGFQLWLRTQPEDYRSQIAGTDKAKDLLGALGKYDAYARTTSGRNPADTRQQRIAAAVAPQADGRRPGRAAVEDDEDAAFAAGFRSG